MYNGIIPTIAQPHALRQQEKVTEKGNEETGILNSEELKGAREVLKAAALTYVAAAFTSVISLLRLLFIAKRRD